jgi:hypothetical protein
MSTMDACDSSVDNKDSHATADIKIMSNSAMNDNKDSHTTTDIKIISNDILPPKKYKFDTEDDVDSYYKRILYAQTLLDKINGDPSSNIYSMDNIKRIEAANLLQTVIEYSLKDKDLSIHDHQLLRDIYGDEYLNTLQK